ncbi:MAG: hypothetical protein IKJ11_10485 [Clostridia bacterium]|nr:hypothetical protein [Clostridia bacterium]
MMKAYHMQSHGAMPVRQMIHWRHRIVRFPPYSASLDSHAHRNQHHQQRNARDTRNHGQLFFLDDLFLPAVLLGNALARLFSSLAVFAQKCIDEALLRFAAVSGITAKKPSVCTEGFIKFTLEPHNQTLCQSRASERFLRARCH